MNKIYIESRCASCEKVFKCNASLIKHTRKVHQGLDNDKIHKCETCEKSFSDIGHLKTHIRIVHEGQKKFKCDTCGKTFGWSSSLKNHIIPLI